VLSRCGLSEHPTDCQVHMCKSSKWHKVVDKYLEIHYNLRVEQKSIIQDSEISLFVGNLSFLKNTKS